MYADLRIYFIYFAAKPMMIAFEDEFQARLRGLSLLEGLVSRGSKFVGFGGLYKREGGGKGVVALYHEIPIRRYRCFGSCKTTNYDQRIKQGN